MNKNASIATVNCNVQNPPARQYFNVSLSSAFLLLLSNKVLITNLSAFGNCQ